MATKKQSIADRAMLVTLDVRTWMAIKSDERPAASAAKRYKSDSKAVIAHKRLLPPSSAYGDIRSAVNKARTAHDYHTLPWETRGAHLLPVDNFQTYSETMRKVIREFDEARDEFCKQYAKLRTNAKTFLGELYDESNYPTGAELRSRFSMRIKISPVARSGDFRVQVSAQQLKELQKQIEADVTDNLSQAVRELWQRLYDVVAKVAERLKSSDAKFHASLIENVRAVCKLLPKLNLTGDKKLEDLRKEIEQSLGKLVPETLREDEDHRQQTAKKAEQIQRKMEKIMKGLKS